MYITHVIKCVGIIKTGTSWIIFKNGSNYIFKSIMPDYPRIYKRRINDLQVRFYKKLYVLYVSYDLFGRYKCVVYSQESGEEENLFEFWNKDWVIIY